MREPLARIPLRDVRLHSERDARRRPGRFQGLVQTEAMTDAHKRYAGSTPQIPQHFLDELLKLRFIEHSDLRGASNSYRVIATKGMSVKRTMTADGTTTARLGQNGPRHFPFLRAAFEILCQYMVYVEGYD
jgi:hypothetical protein